jgi:predicted AlkP superfamily phosphohydrolase/phosphomutase
VRPLKLVVTLARLVAGLALLLAAPAGAEPRRLVLVSWDGGADWVIDRLLDEGRLPHLARLAARGAAVDYSVPSFPSKTAVSHAALWTGCWAPCNGIVANSVPVASPAAEDVLQSRSGFDSHALAAEPLWMTAALAGRRVVVLSATQSDPPQPHAERLRAAGVSADGFRSFNGFGHEAAPARVIDETALRPARAAAWRPVPLHRGSPRELAIEIGETRLFGLVYDDPADPARGFDTLLVRAGSREDASRQTILKPREAAPPGQAGGPPAGWSPPFPIAPGPWAPNTFLRLFRLSPDGKELVLYLRGASELHGVFTSEDRAAYLAAYPGFHDDPFEVYHENRLGVPLIDGGDGTAERRLLEMVAFDTALLAAGTRFALATWRPDLLFHYSPMSDHAGHAWIGVLDPASPAHDAALAERLWPYYAGVFAALDAWLGEVVAAAGEEAIVALVSDHGMAGVGRTLHVNRVLEQAGLLERTAAGEIDPQRTRILLPSWAAFFLVVNDSRFQGGPVPEAERERVIERAAAALLAARDPRSGAALVERVFRPQDFPGLGIGGPRGGDLYFDPAPGLYPSARLRDEVVSAARNAGGSGEHGYYPERRAMHAIFYLAGPGVAAGARLPAIRHIDVAPTLARLLGLPAPPQSIGRIVAEALGAVP